MRPSLDPSSLITLRPDLWSQASNTGPEPGTHNFPSISMTLSLGSSLVCVFVRTLAKIVLFIAWQIWFIPVYCRGQHVSSVTLSFSFNQTREVEYFKDPFDNTVTDIGDIQLAFSGPLRLQRM
ncbi:hypothetical protein RRG08_005822, partial [Elysia crispata]